GFKVTCTARTVDRKKRRGATVAPRRRGHQPTFFTAAGAPGFGAVSPGAGGVTPPSGAGPPSLLIGVESDGARSCRYCGDDVPSASPTTRRNTTSPSLAACLALARACCASASAVVVLSTSASDSSTFGACVPKGPFCNSSAHGSLACDCT